VTINGLEQWLYVRLNPRAKGTLLFLHGGPGWADAPWAHFVCADLWNDFNIVHWDQRGTSRTYSQSNATSQESLTVEIMVKDCISVLEYLVDDLRLKKITVVGHSWGAVLGVLLANRRPELLKGLVSIGQLVKSSLSEPKSLRYCKKMATEFGRSDLDKIIKKLPPNFYKNVDTLFIQREILGELNGDFSTSVVRNAYQEVAEGAPENYFMSWEQLNESCMRSVRQLWDELTQIDFFKKGVDFKVPFLLMQGIHDHCTDFETAQDWFKKIKSSSNKKSIQFDRSSHWPQFEENEKFVRILKDWCFKL